jgi:hypothetical protein
MESTEDNRAVSSAQIEADFDPARIFKRSNVSARWVGLTLPGAR